MPPRDAIATPRGHRCEATCSACVFPDQGQGLPIGCRVILPPSSHLVPRSATPRTRRRRRSPGGPATRRRSTRVSPLIASRWRRSAARFLWPRISAGVAAPTRSRARTSTATRRPVSSRARMSISSPATRRLRAKICQPALASAAAASRSAAAPISARWFDTGRDSAVGRTVRVLARRGLRRFGRFAPQLGHTFVGDVALRQADQERQDGAVRDIRHWSPIHSLDIARRAAPSTDHEAPLQQWTRRQSNRRWCPP